MLQEERKKIAAGAETDGVPVLLPKYAHAAKKLRGVQAAKNDLIGAKRLNDLNASRDGFEDLPTAEEIFTREENPWAEEEDG